MKTGHSKIQITACSEQWEAMSPTAAGRFCDLCSKNVIDFTAKSDEEIVTYLGPKKDESVCGRFYRQQVDRIRIEIDHTLLRSGIPFWQKFLVIVLVCFGQQCFGIDFCFAQTTDSLSAPTVQVDSLIPVSQDTLAQDTLVQDTLTHVPATKKTAVRERKFEPIYIVYGNISMPLEKPLIGAFSEERVQIPFQEPGMAVGVPPLESGEGTHLSGKTSNRQAPEQTPDPPQLVAVLPLAARKRRKRNRPKQH